jgi:hypothetical protein
MLFHWLYSGRLYSSLATDGGLPISDLDLCALFVLGDYCGIPELCNEAVDLFFQSFASNWVFPTDCLPYVYDSTLPNSKLRAILVDLAVGSFSFSTIKISEHLYPKEFLSDVILRSRELKHWPGDIDNKTWFLHQNAAKLCMYHDHEDPYAAPGSGCT